MTDTIITPAMPRINEPAPDFSAKTTHGQRSLADYRGKWLVLFSHPADFTPVCTTEFMGFARHADEFKAMNTELLGLSIDSNYAHIAWVRSIRGEIRRRDPLPDHRGHLDEGGNRLRHGPSGASDTQAVRATFFIDPEGTLRAMVYYPMSNGRSIAEFVRLMQALQTADANKVATPEGWQPGDKVIVPPPQTAPAAEARAGEGYDYVDWYFSTKTL